MSKQVGQRKVRVDAFDKATGRAMYTDDLCGQDALVVRLVHATVAHGLVKSIDTAAAEQVEGVVKVLTCFDVPNYPFPTAGHPWSTDPHHQDVADRLLMNRHVRYYGDEVAAVIAEDEVAAAQAVRALKVEYEELPFVLDVQKAMEDGAPQLHEEYKNNIHDIKALQEAIDQWIAEVADARVHGGKTVAQLFEEERAMLVDPGHADTYMPIAHRMQVVSKRAGVHIYGQRFQLPPETAEKCVAITVRHNGEFLISTPEGRQLLTGTIPLEQMQTYKFESLEVKADTAPAEEPEQPIKVNKHMLDLVGIEDFTYG